MSLTSNEKNNTVTCWEMCTFACEWPSKSVNVVEALKSYVKQISGANRERGREEDALVRDELLGLTRTQQNAGMKGMCLK